MPSPIRVLSLLLPVLLIACPGSEDEPETDESVAEEATEPDDDQPEASDDGETDEPEGDEVDPSAEELAPVRAESLHGSWTMDTEAYVASFPEEDRQAMEAFMGSMDMTMRFGDDGTTATTVRFIEDTQSREGTWEMTSFEEGVMVLDMTLDPDEGEEEGETDTVTITFSGPDRFSIVMEGEDPETDTLYFVRQSP